MSTNGINERILKSLKVGRSLLDLSCEAKKPLNEFRSQLQTNEIKQEVDSLQYLLREDLRNNIFFLLKKAMLTSEELLLSKNERIKREAVRDIYSFAKDILPLIDEEPEEEVNQLELNL